MLGDYLVGVAFEQVTGDRLAGLKMAREFYERFLRRTLQYGVFDARHGEHAKLRQLLDSDRDDAEEQLAAWLVTVPRDLKIGRMRRTMALRAETASMAPPKDDGVKSGAGFYWRAHVNLAVLDTLDRLGLLLREMEVLRMGNEGPGEPVASRTMTSRTGVESRVEQSFTLLRDRKQTREDAFRPGHRLPSMTIDEYLALEMKRGNVISGGGAASASTTIELDEDDETQLARQRQFDDFKDSTRLHKWVY